MNSKDRMEAAIAAQEAQKVATEIYIRRLNETRIALLNLGRKKHFTAWGELSDGGEFNFDWIIGQPISKIEFDAQGNILATFVARKATYTQGRPVYHEEFQTIKISKAWLSLSIWDACSLARKAMKRRRDAAIQREVEEAARAFKAAERAVSAARTAAAKAEVAVEEKRRIRENLTAKHRAKLDADAAQRQALAG